MSGRDLIATALNAIEGVTGHPYEPANKAPGMGWPVLRQVTRDGTMCGPYVRSYDVFVLVTNNHPTAAEDAVEDLIEQVVAALEPLGEWVEPAEPRLIQFDNNETAPGIRVQITIDPAEEA